MSAFYLGGNGICCGQDVPNLRETPTVQRISPDDWQVCEGDWQVGENALIADAMQLDSYIVAGESWWQNYEVEANVTFREVRDSSCWLSILVRASKDGSRACSQVPVRFDTKASNGMEFAVRNADESWNIRGKASASGGSKLNVSRRLKVTVRGSHVEGHLDGERVVSSHLCLDRPTGCIGLGASGCVVVFDSLSVRHLPVTTETVAGSSQGCDLVADQGPSESGSENTLAAIRLAIETGATGCGFDVYGRKDGNVVLRHDKTVDATTNGPVTGLTVQTLGSLEPGFWKDPKYSNENVPTLIDALKLLKGTQCQPVIEIKMEGISKQVVDDVRALGMVDQVAVIAFNQDVVSEIRKLEPRITCAWLHGKTPRGTPVQQAEWLKTQADQCKANIVDLNYSMLSPQLIAELKQRDLGVWTWTVNEPIVMRALRKWGVDRITTDHPDRLCDLQD